jgi:hypothetical protein
MKALKKIFTALFFVVSVNSLVIGFILSISNYQGKLHPDGYPLDPWWLIAILFMIAIMAGIFSGLLYSKK